MGPTVVTIGTFDGVHLGHQKIIKRLVAEAKSRQLESVVLTFFPHPRMVLQKDANIKLINTIEEKEAILKSFGLSKLVVNPFTKAFSRLTAEEFVEQILVQQLQAKHVIIGYDHHFGRNRNANIDDLKKFGEVYNFTVEEISAQDVDDVAVSSTKIRTALQEGDIETANTFLNYKFMLSGIVVKGKGIGKTINYPTANLQIEEDYKLIPKNGVYIVKSTINNNEVYGMMNIGFNPTVNGQHKTIEVHFLNFKDDLYNKSLQVELIKRIRNEIKFNTLSDLKAQIAIDQKFTLDFINNVK
ncbi:bifunctional riboflavin kinase/FAD synthetase [Aurantibacter aestuarii]|uniref:bifunctional riboflavin kinase/FAD synthetase n=1 Tax=Aurantibacter aestuarii TaxID=1266046 RepID=UPI001FE31356|nr:bifunctional riboflavin kinase/FAD synthetase [Aurantibacter aestuarii]